MAYGSKYYAELQSRAGELWKISIYKEGYTSTTQTELTLWGPDGFVLSYNGEGDEIHEPIKASDLKFSVTATQAIMTALVADIVDSGSHSFIIKLEKWNDDHIPDPAYEFFWGGILTHEITEIPDQYQYVVEFSAIDGLSTLNDIEMTTEEFEDIATVYQDFHVRPSELIAAILRQLPWVTTFAPTFTLKWSDDWSETSIGTKYWQNTLYVNLRVFSTYNKRTSKFDMVKFYDILQEVLLSFNSEIALISGNFQIINKDYRRTTEARNCVYFEAETALATGTEASEVSILQTRNNARLAGGKFMYRQPVKKVTKKITYENNSDANNNQTIYDQLNNIAVTLVGTTFVGSGDLICEDIMADDVKKFRIKYDFGYHIRIAATNDNYEGYCAIDLKVKITNGGVSYYLNGNSNALSQAQWLTDSNSRYAIISNPTQAEDTSPGGAVVQEKYYDGDFINEFIVTLPFTSNIIETTIAFDFDSFYFNGPSFSASDIIEFNTVIENKYFYIEPLNSNNEQPTGFVTFSSVATNGNDLIYELPDGLLHDGSDGTGLFYNNNTGALSVLPATIVRTKKWYEKTVGTSSQYYLPEMCCRSVHRYTYKPLKLYQGNIVNSGLNFNDTVVLDYDTYKLYLCFNGGQYRGKQDQWTAEFWAVRQEANPETLIETATGKPFAGIDISRSASSHPYSLGNSSKIGDHFTINNFILEYQTQSKNFVLAAPAGTNGYPNFRELHDFTYIDFDLTIGTTIANAEGRMKWDDDNKTVVVGMSGGNVNLQLGQEQLLRAKNDEGSVIKNGEVVYISGRDGTNPLIKKARADSYLRSDTIIGVATEDISTFGYVCTYGIVRDINLSAFSDNAIVYLSAGTGGQITTSKPDAPGYVYRIGIVEYAHGTEGRLRVNIQREWSRWGSDSQYSYFNTLGQWVIRGTGTGVTTVKTANTGTTNYEATFQSKTGTVAYLADIGTGGSSYAGTSGSILFVGTNGLISEYGAGFFYDIANNRVGVGGNSPNYRIESIGTAISQGIRSWMGFDVYPVPPPTTITGTKAVGTSLEVGTYFYLVTYYTGIGETSMKQSDRVYTTIGTTHVIVTLPVSSDPRVIGRRLYRTKVNTLASQDYFLVEINNNTATTYTDTTPDASLTLGPLNAFYKPNTTAPILSILGTNYFTLENELIAIGSGAAGTNGQAYGATVMGYKAGFNLTSANSPTLFGYWAGYDSQNPLYMTAIGYEAARFQTTAANTVAVGYRAALYNVTGGYNTAVGASAMRGASTKSPQYSTAIGALAGYSLEGAYNTFLGSYAGYASAAINNGIHIGYYAGRYETAGAKLIIDSFNRTNEANQRLYAIIYGVLSSTAASQILSLGGTGKVGINNTSPNSTFHVTGSQAVTYTAVSTTYTATANDFWINVTSGTVTINLPTAVGIAGREYSITNSNTGVVTITPNGSETINGGSSITLTRWQHSTIRSDGANWVEID